ncbi:hypothetical protein BGX33_011852 [Mortierella sp. NVP41]|nr:hypothetical protein BGX33_011852 [Mortierella sp. NVP41]
MYTLIGRGQVPRASVEQQLFIKLPELNVNINQGRERWRDACRRERLIGSTTLDRVRADFERAQAQAQAVSQMVKDLTEGHKERARERYTTLMDMLTLLQKSVLIEMISQERDRKARGGAVENKDDVAKLTALLDALKAGGEEDDKDDVAGNA